MVDQNYNVLDRVVVTQLQSNRWTVRARYRLLCTCVCACVCAVCACCGCTSHHTARQHLLNTRKEVPVITAVHSSFAEMSQCAAICVCVCVRGDSVTVSLYT
eukprot:m.59846 g.59846  ORF g.59846 m.59846 type:complete len:102 (+) comp7915_c0_seq2:1023-1328(+)